MYVCILYFEKVCSWRRRLRIRADFLRTNTFVILLLLLVIGIRSRVSASNQCSVLRRLAHEVSDVGARWLHLPVGACSQCPHARQNQYRRRSRNVTTTQPNSSVREHDNMQRNERRRPVDLLSHYGYTTRSL